MFLQLVIGDMDEKYLRINLKVDEVVAEKHHMNQFIIQYFNLLDESNND